MITRTLLTRRSDANLAPGRRQRLGTGTLVLVILALAVVGAEASLDDPATVTPANGSLESTLWWITHRHDAILVFSAAGELEAVKIYRAHSVDSSLTSVLGEPLSTSGDAEMAPAPRSPRSAPLAVDRLVEPAPLDALAALLAPSTDAETRRRALDSLRSSGVGDADTLAQVALEDPEPVLRREALELLGLWAEIDPSARRRLRDLANLGPGVVIGEEARSLLAALDADAAPGRR